MQTHSQRELGEKNLPGKTRSATLPLLACWVASVIISLAISFGISWSFGTHADRNAFMSGPVTPVSHVHAAPEPAAPPEPREQTREQSPEPDHSDPGTREGANAPDSEAKGSLPVSASDELRESAEPGEHMTLETPAEQQTGSDPGTGIASEPALDQVIAEPTDTRPVAVRNIGSFVLVVSSGNAASRTGPDPAAMPPAIDRYDVLCRSKIVALTFDDGPHPVYTPRILDLLKKHRATATFFVIGSQAAKYPDLINRIHAEGHEIGNHGYTHRVTHSTPYSKQVEDIQHASELIDSLIGKPTKWYRPNNMVISPMLLHAIEMTGHIMVLWTIDTRDWAARTSDSIVQAIPPDLRPGSVVLLHDGGGNRQPTVEALDQILLRLSERGYKAVTLSDIVRDVEDPIPGLPPR